jgi:hypothetical protein
MDSPVCLATKKVAHDLPIADIAQAPALAGISREVIQIGMKP